MWANKISASGVILKWVKSNRRSEKKKVSENNGQLRFRPSPSWTKYLFRTGHFSVPRASIYLYLSNSTAEKTLETLEIT